MSRLQVAVVYADRSLILYTLPKGNAVVHDRNSEIASRNKKWSQGVEGQALPVCRLDGKLFI